MMEDIKIITSKHMTFKPGKSINIDVGAQTLMNDVFSAWIRSDEAVNHVLRAFKEGLDAKYDGTVRVECAKDSTSQYVIYEVIWMVDNSAAPPRTVMFGESFGNDVEKYTVRASAVGLLCDEFMATLLLMLPEALL